MYEISKDLVLALLNNISALTSTVHGGNYARHSEVMMLEDVLPVTFPYGGGGPVLNRRMIRRGHSSSLSPYISPTIHGKSICSCSE